VVAVWKAVLSSGVKPESIGMMGDSAGAGLAAGSVLKMRDRHLPLPGALYLLSPSVDLSGAGDTSTTLAPVDPVLAPDTSAWSREAYAAVTDQKNPYVSPVYGDYTQAFPPTLIQAGTREMLLSGAVREYQAIRSGGHEAVLDIYEGLPHDWFGLIPQAPETKTAVSRASDFFASHLGNGSK
jgi:monoterpene epsilon-lactone hydrolase